MNNIPWLIQCVGVDALLGIQSNPSLSYLLHQIRVTRSKIRRDQSIDGLVDQLFSFVPEKIENILVGIVYLVHLIVGYSQYNDTCVFIVEYLPESLFEAYILWVEWYLGYLTIDVQVIWSLKFLLEQDQLFEVKVEILQNDVIAVQKGNWLENLTDFLLENKQMKHALIQWEIWLVFLSNEIFLQLYLLAKK